MRAKALNTDDLSLRIARSGSADLAGRAARLDIDLSGSGGIDAADLRADDVHVSIAR
ncbi:MAG: GIN domain-containing protein, partial [Burkholderiales bacterium]